MRGKCAVVTTPLAYRPAVFAIVNWVHVSNEPMAHFMNTLIDFKAADGHFKTPAKALTAPGFIDAPKGVGPFTVFAPTDCA